MALAQRIYTPKHRQKLQFSKGSASSDRTTRRRPAIKFVRYLVFLLCASISKWAFINNAQSCQLHHNLVSAPNNYSQQPFSIQPFSINSQPEVLYDGGTAAPELTVNSNCPANSLRLYPIDNSKMTKVQDWLGLELKVLSGRGKAPSA